MRYSGASTPKSGSSGISGGAIAGIVIGALAGVAIVAALAFFMMRRRRRSGMATIPSKMEAGSLGEDQDTVGALPAKNGDLHSSLAPLHSGYGLSWKEGDEVRDGKQQDGIRSSSQVLRSRRLAVACPACCAAHQQPWAQEAA